MATDKKTDLEKMETKFNALLKEVKALKLDEETAFKDEIALKQLDLNLSRAYQVYSLQTRHNHKKA